MSIRCSVFLCIQTSTFFCDPSWIFSLYDVLRVSCKR